MHSVPDILDAIAQWFNVDRWIAIVGLLVTLAALAVTIWQIRRARSAAESARAASVRTKETIRSGGLSKLIEISMTCRSRLEQVPAGTAEPVRIILRDWLTAYPRIYGLLDTSSDFKNDMRHRAIETTEVTKGHVLTAHDLLATRRVFRIDTNLKQLKRALLEYEQVMNSVLLCIEDAEVGRNG